MGCHRHPYKVPNIEPSLNSLHVICCKKFLKSMHAYQKAYLPQHYRKKLLSFRILIYTLSEN